MTYSVTISAAGPEPVSLSQVRMHAKIDDNTEDAIILDYIAGARQKIEQWTGLLLRSCTMTLKLDAFDDPILLPRAPVRSITSITYTDGDGDAQTVAGSDYALREYMGQYQITPLGNTWPTIEDYSQVTVVAVAGFETPNDVDFDLKAVIYRMVSHMDANRGEQGGLEGFGSQVVNHRLSWAF